MAKEEQSIHILRKLVVDALLLVFLALSIFATSLLWPTFERGFFCGDESLMYPYKEDTVTVPVLRVVGLALPIAAFLACEWSYLRKVRDDQRCLGVRLPVWVRGFYCVLLSFAIGLCFVEVTTNIAKKTIGRPRPHFFDICRPSIDCSSPEWTGRYIQSADYTCTGTRVDRMEEMRKSFLSGHSSWAAFSMIYLALYLQNRMTWQGTRALRHTLQYGAVMLSWFTALSRISDFKHHWSDVLAGYSLGTIFAVIMWVWGTDLIQKKKNHSSLAQFEDVQISNQQTT